VSVGREGARKKFRQSDGIQEGWSSPPKLKKKKRSLDKGKPQRKFVPSCCDKTEKGQIKNLCQTTRRKTRVSSTQMSGKYGATLANASRHLYKESIKVRMNAECTSEKQMAIERSLKKEPGIGATKKRKVDHIYKVTTTSQGQHRKRGKETEKIDFGNPFP